MTLASGTKLGPYEILAPLGAGGMGEVYKAKDARLDRFIAVKVLPEHLAKNPESRARFEGEAKAVAALNHPNITGLHDIGRVGSISYAVMELLEGESLRARLARGPVTVRQAVDLAAQMAQGLSAAHEKGLIHRDLKPENLWITKDGRLKILDFGLAKQLAAPGFGTGSKLPTESMQVGGVFTEEGKILGTLGYMSPEQVRGEAVDARSDLFNFGVVLFEMLTGRKAFARDSPSDTMAAILRDDPLELEAASQPLPPALRRILVHCLEKWPDRRFQESRDLAFALESLSDFSSASATFAPRNRWGLLRGALLLLLVGGFASLGAWILGRRGVPARGELLRVAFQPPEGLAFDPWGLHFAALSPDGTKVVFSARTPGGVRQLWVRTLDRAEAQLLPDTADALEPVWSPDSRSVAYGARGKLCRVDLGAARAQTLCDAARLNAGAAWSPLGVILFVPDYGLPICQVKASGGAREVAVPNRPSSGGDGAARNPSFLPDGQRFLATVEGQLCAGKLGSPDLIPLPGLPPDAVFVSPGWLCFEHAGALCLQAFHLRTLTLQGERVAVADLASHVERPRTRVTLSSNGHLCFPVVRPQPVQLSWFSREGKKLGTLGEVARQVASLEPDLSPDGQRALVQRIDPATRNQDLWMIDVMRNTSTRVTSDLALDQRPTWSYDGSRVIWMTHRGGVPGIYEIPTGGGTERLLQKGVHFPVQEAPDGNHILFRKRGERTRLDLWSLPRKGGEPLPLLDSEFEESTIRLSPDGRWLAYASDATGSNEVYLRPMRAFGRPGSATRISNGGGLHPRWRKDGRELFFMTQPTDPLRGQIMAVSLEFQGEAVTVGPPKALFTPRKSPIDSQGGYDVSADGRFLVEVLVGEPVPPEVTLILNWPVAFQR